MNEIILHELAIFGAENNVSHFKNNELISKGDQHLKSDRKDKHLVVNWVNYARALTQFTRMACSPGYLL
jgi:hypothetical protein